MLAYNSEFLASPFLCQLHWAFQTDREVFLVMDFMHGGDLRYRMRDPNNPDSYRRLPEHVVKFYAAELLLALRDLHSVDLVYRDLKPENVLLDDRGHCHLADFGITDRIFYDQVTNEPILLTEPIGTKSYMTPEQKSSKPYGKEVDFWALGVLIHELLTTLIPPICQVAKSQQDLIVIPANASIPIESASRGEAIRKAVSRSVRTSRSSFGSVRRSLSDFRASMGSRSGRRASRRTSTSTSTGTRNNSNRTTDSTNSESRTASLESPTSLGFSTSSASPVRSDSVEVKIPDVVSPDRVPSVAQSIPTQLAVTIDAEDSRALTSPSQHSAAPLSSTNSAAPLLFQHQPFTPSAPHSAAMYSKMTTQTPSPESMGAMLPPLSETSSALQGPHCSTPSSPQGISLISPVTITEPHDDSSMHGDRTLYNVSIPEGSAVGISNTVANLQSTSPTEVETSRVQSDESVSVAVMITNVSPSASALTQDVSPSDSPVLTVADSGSNATSHTNKTGSHKSRASSKHNKAPSRIDTNNSVTSRSRRASRVHVHELYDIDPNTVVGNLITRLLHPDPKQRYTTFEQISKHPWFADIDWLALYEGRVPPPIEPPGRDSVNFSGAVALEAVLNKTPPKPIPESLQCVFEGFEYIHPSHYEITLPGKKPEFDHQFMQSEIEPPPYVTPQSAGSENGPPSIEMTTFSEQQVPFAKPTETTQPYVHPETNSE